MKKLAVSFALSAVLWLPSANAIEWFPAEPGHGEPQYLMYMDFCGSEAPIGRPILSLLDEQYGRWELRIVQDVGGCFATPAEGSARAYAFEIPAQIEGVAVIEVRAVQRFGTSPNAPELATTTIRPDSVATPTSIVGTWNYPQAYEQGLLITMNEARQLVVSLNTYNAQGAKTWLSGIAWGRGDVVTVTLTDTGTGMFMDAASNDSAAKQWGKIDVDWQACGKLRLDWRPETSTGLSAGGAEFIQLTGSASAPCNLAVYARERNGEPVYVEYDVEL